MVKKLMWLAASIAALTALVVPAAANATPVLTSASEPGVAIPKSTEITGTAITSITPFEVETWFGVLYCESVMLNAEVTRNNGTEFELEGNEGGTTSGCRWGSEEEATVGELFIHRLVSSAVEGETGTGTFELSFQFGLFEFPMFPKSCEFSNVGKPGIVHYVLGSDELILTPALSKSLCVGEPIIIRGELTLETKDGTPVLAS